VNKISFDAQYGDKFMHVELAKMKGGGEGYQVLIDHYYHGQIYFRDGAWHAHLNDKSFLTSDDIMILGEYIDHYEKKK
jgi:hypothetical protein